jgi:hypothetical protein
MRLLKILRLCAAWLGNLRSSLSIPRKPEGELAIFRFRNLLTRLYSLAVTAGHDRQYALGLSTFTSLLQ